jgi:hypothetical protein
MAVFIATKVQVQVLSLASIEQNEAVHQDARVSGISPRSAFNVSSRPKNGNEHEKFRASSFSDVSSLDSFPATPSRNSGVAALPKEDIPHSCKEDGGSRSKCYKRPIVPVQRCDMKHVREARRLDQHES